jgi:hypothetical protein
VQPGRCWRRGRHSAPPPPDAVRGEGYVLIRATDRTPGAQPRTRRADTLETLDNRTRLWRDTRGRENASIGDRPRQRRSKTITNPNETQSAATEELNETSLDLVVGGIIMHDISLRGVIIHDIALHDGK